MQRTHVSTAIVSFVVAWPKAFNSAMPQRGSWRLQVNIANTSSQPVSRTQDLEHRQLLVLADRPGTRIKVLSGRAWLTEEGQPEDRFAQPGEELRVTHRGRAIVEGIGRTRLQLVQPAMSMARRLGALLPAPQAMLPRTLALVLSLVIALGLPELLARSFMQFDSQVAAQTVATQAPPLA
jgi:hypothetical protein